MTSFVKSTGRCRPRFRSVAAGFTLCREGRIAGVAQGIAAGAPIRPRSATSTKKRRTPRARKRSPGGSASRRAPPNLHSSLKITDARRAGDAFDPGDAANNDRR